MGNEEIPGWVSDPLSVACVGPDRDAVRAMPGAPQASDLQDLPLEERAGGDAWAYCWLLIEFARERAREWCAAHGLVLSAAECGVAIAGPLDAYWRPDRGVVT